MKTFAMAGLAAALFAVPAAAQAQAFIQAETGLDNVSVYGESKSGVTYGVSAGYDMNISNGMFIGIQGTVADSSTKYCERDFFLTNDRWCLRTGRDLAAVARLGTSMGERSKLYVLGGYTNARVRETYEFANIDVSEGESGSGFRLGAGTQYDLSSTLFLKAEYRYSNYEGDFTRHNGVIALGAKF